MKYGGKRSKRKTALSVERGLEQVLFLFRQASLMLGPIHEPQEDDGA